MAELTIKEKAKAYDEAIERVVNIRTGKCETTFIFTEGLFNYLFPELEECNEEEVRKAMIEFFKHEREEGVTVLHYGVNIERMIAWLEKWGNADLEFFENGENEKREFVGYGFLKCKGDFLSFKEGETYWLEYVGKDNYNVRSDNLLGQTFHITPQQLYTVFRPTTWLEKQEEQNLIMAKSPQLGEQKQEENKRNLGGISSNWSEENENILEAITYTVKNSGYSHCIGVSIKVMIDWLKSLKQRIGG